MAKKEHLIGLFAFVALLCLMVILYSVSKQQPGLSIPAPGGGSYTSHGPQAAASGTLPIQVSDPSYLPKGTSALWVTFTNASVYSQAAGWRSGGGFGPVNLLASQGNRSVTISLISVPYNSIISAARLGIGSAYMIINGARYNVTVPGGLVTTNLSGVRFGDGNALLLDLSPFALPSAGSHNSIALGCSSRGFLVNGSGGYIGQQNRVALAAAQSVTPYANISVDNVVITASGGVTTIRITVVNHSNRTARIGSVAVIGSESFARNSSAIAALSSRYAEAIVQRYASEAQAAGASGSAGGGAGGSLVSSLLNASISGISAGMSSALYSKALAFGANLTSLVYGNVSALAQMAGPLPRSLLDSRGGINVTALGGAVYQNVYSGISNASVSSANLQSNIDTVGFAPSQDGTLEQSWNPGGEGYEIRPDSSATLEYRGQLSLDNTTSIGLAPDSGYQVVVAGDNGTGTSYEATSGG